MPNWCMNTLQVKGPADDLARFREQAKGTGVIDYSGTEGELPLQMGSFVPEPEGLVENSDNTVRPGKTPDWYEWRHANWGVKWELGGTIEVQDGGDYLIYDFDTPWGPPYMFLAKVSAMFPALRFTLEYSEPMMEVQGSITAAEGVATDDEGVVTTA